MKRFIVAPDSFKGTLSATEVCSIMETAIKKYIPDANVEKLPMADGGEGVVASYLNVCGGRTVSARVSGPFFEPVDAAYGILENGTAVIEMASCAGLPMVGDRKDPLNTTTYGVGELIRHAAANGVKQIILGLGGSATNDCGIGMAAALGYKLFNGAGEVVSPVGGAIGDIARIEKPESLPGVRVMGACDVDNPLYGPSGAAHIFGPQKGADPAMVEFLDAGLVNMANVIRRDVGIDVANIPGSGAAGGLGAGVIAFLNGILRPGIQLLMDAAGFDSMLANCDVVFTGEGRIDGQSTRGKVPVGVAGRAKKQGVPCIALCGAIGDGAEAAYDYGITAIFSSISGCLDFESLKRTAADDMRRLTEAVVRILLI